MLPSERWKHNRLNQNSVAKCIHEQRHNLAHLPRSARARARVLASSPKRSLFDIKDRKQTCAETILIPWSCVRCFGRSELQGSVVTPEYKRQSHAVVSRDPLLL